MDLFVPAYAELSRLLSEHLAEALARTDGQGLAACRESLHALSRLSEHVTYSDQKCGADLNEFFELAVTAVRIVPQFSGKSRTSSPNDAQVFANYEQYVVSCLALLHCLIVCARTKAIEDCSIDIALDGPTDNSPNELTIRLAPSHRNRDDGDSLYSEIATGIEASWAPTGNNVTVSHDHAAENLICSFSLADVSSLTGLPKVLQTEHALSDLNAIQPDSGKYSTDFSTLHEPSVILVVDDDASVRVTLAKILEADGFKAVQCADGAEAIEICRETCPELIVMDALMANVDGFTATAEIHKLPNRSHIPVLIATALEDDDSIERAFKAGAADYLQKPFHINTIRQRISRILHAGQNAKNVQRLALIDGVTGLSNRTYFQRQLHEITDLQNSSESGYGVIFIDIDRFKLVNETLGHENGDNLLRQIAERLVGAVRGRDLVARLGSDEFAIVVRDAADTATINIITDKIINDLSHPIHIGDEELFVSCTMGISLYPTDARDPSALMRHADSALFHARRNDLNVSYYDESMESRATTQLSIHSNLRRALGTDQFELHYQPQITLPTKRFASVESLIRWRHPSRGLVSPGTFIPVAEDTGFIVELGNWVLNESCRFLRSVKTEYPETVLERVSVNVSTRQLDCADFSEQVEEALAASDLPGECLELEITESAVMKRSDLVLQTLNDIKAMGVRIAIDDFGAGYCSFGYLKKFPIDVLKIDRSLIQDLNVDYNDQQIVRAIIALAETLGLETVAEGAEDLTQVSLLHEIGCEKIQGYFFSKPLPETELIDGFVANAPTVPDFDNDIHLGVKRSA